jgi:hypothetical protein
MVIVPAQIPVPAVFVYSYWRMSRSQFALFALAGLAAALYAQQGYKDTPILPGQRWHVHDPDRPHPAAVTPGAEPGAPPSDAVVLFGGKDLSQWEQHDHGKTVAAKWKVEGGYFEVAPGTGDLISRASFGDCQLHVEWSEPATVSGSSQNRGNSGIYLQSLYEMQVLDSYNQPTYADGQAAAIYGQWPPLVNPIRPPGQWNTYDIVFEAPKFDGEKLVKPAFVTNFFNGIVVHNRKELNGSTEHRALGTYKPHGDAPLLFQDHGHPVRYRNIWIRAVKGYDQPEK